MDAGDGLSGPVGAVNKHSEALCVQQVYEAAAGCDSVPLDGNTNSLMRGSAALRHHTAHRSDTLSKHSGRYMSVHTHRTKH